MKPALAALLDHPLVWRGDRLAPADDAVGSGYAELDRELPGGGWPKGALTELLHPTQGIGELRLLAPALSRLARAGDAIVLVAPPQLPYAPAFAAFGIDPARLFAVAALQGKDRWWAAEQALRGEGVAALLFWPGECHEKRLRRLQLAAQDSAALAFVFAAAAGALESSPSPLRLRLTAERGRLCIDVFKRRGGPMARPLLLDLRPPTMAADRHPPTSASPGGMPAGDCLATVRAVSFKTHYPVGAPAAQIWNRALARADEVRRGSRPDPRLRMSGHRPSPAQLRLPDSRCSAVAAAEEQR